jgi:VWFA-related protein
MTTYSQFGIALLAALSLSVPGFAQNTVPPAPAFAATYAASMAIAGSVTSADEPILTIKKRVDEVNVLFIATDRHGKFVRNLNQADFSILDDHKPVQSIVNFRLETDLPIRMGLLVDMSASVHSRFDFEKEAATGFLQHVLRPGYDQAFVVGFNKNSHLTQDFTDNVQLLSTGVRELSGSRAVYDAIKSLSGKLHERTVVHGLIVVAMARTIRAKSRAHRPSKWRSARKF